MMSLLKYVVTRELSLGNVSFVFVSLKTDTQIRLTKFVLVISDCHKIPRKNEGLYFNSLVIG